MAVFRDRYRPIFLLLSIFFVSMCEFTFAVSAFGAEASATCPLSTSLYQQKGYKVRNVRVLDPLAFLQKLLGGHNSLVDDLPVQSNDAFSIGDVGRARRLIQDKLDSAQSYDQPIQINVVASSVENCADPNSGPLLLDVVFRVFSTNFSAYLSHTWEFTKKQAEGEQPDRKEKMASQQPLVRFTVSPRFSYDRSAKFLAGAKVALLLRRGPIDNLAVDGSGSENANLEDFEFGKSWHTDHFLANNLEYNVAYRHADVPSTDNRLRQGAIEFRANGATKPFGGYRTLIRYGASFKSGNQQSDFAVDAADESSVADSGDDIFKAFVGTTLTANRLSFSASFGLGIGGDRLSHGVDFAKYIGDIAVSKRWVPKDQAPGEVHKVLILEFRAAGGIIRKFGDVPVTERFFGGNRLRSFTSDSNWEIADGPFIRSIPSARLNADSTIGPIGGDRFYSFNFTASRPFWGQPLLFKEIVTDSDFQGALTAAEESSRSILRNYYATKLNLFDPIVTRMLTTGNPATSVKAMLGDLLTPLNHLPDDLPGCTPSPDDEESTCDYSDQSSDLSGNTIALMMGPLKSKESASSALLGIIRGGEDADKCGPDSLDVCPQLSAIRFSALKFVGTLRRYSDLATDQEMKLQLADAAKEVERVVTAISAEQTTLINMLDQTDVGAAGRLADRDMNDVLPVISTTTDEMNLWAVSPVAMFDAARLYPDRFGTRFGAGPGIRFSLANINFTAGYVFSLNRKPGDARGGFTFAFTITDLFR
ncbi:MAG: hypothetical protein ABI999_12485 [Acidobacteriota bacterium]